MKVFITRLRYSSFDKSTLTLQNLLSSVFIVALLSYHSHPFPTRPSVSIENSLSSTVTPIFLPNFRPVPAILASTVPSSTLAPVYAPALRWRFKGPTLASLSVARALASAPNMWPSLTKPLKSNPARAFTSPPRKRAFTLTSNHITTKVKEVCSRPCSNRNTPLRCFQPRVSRKLQKTEVIVPVNPSTSFKLRYVNFCIGSITRVIILHLGVSCELEWCQCQ